ncbi:nacht and wd domain containing protein [Grosmannia clavigera kw1407]|uniref:Nacht and wd domain containing protein n=1 Tax=Grosmannia clavigera (strain kw1407 / UAMH 11150) TaxID=655863 RepID=F0X926_GROCL|nr:nacht and wd domain containing protein [Grosmannia clavigera kw1407]EFX05841.1 nacht and wd domain containing protein [Grosmannia clavigera kw1407]
MIVDKENAVMNLQNERITLLPANHRNVAMFSSQNDPSYIAIRNALATIITEQRNRSQAYGHAVAQEDRLALNRFLNVSGPPEDDFETNNSRRVPGSCQWISRARSYSSWRNVQHPRLLWLHGRPGTGKSVLSSYIIEDLQLEGNVDCCYFFFQSTDSSKATTNACLRSMAWQMAMLHRNIMIRLKQIMMDLDYDPVDRVDHGPVWRNIYSSGILKERPNRPQFWVIDAVDECKNSTELINFIARIQEQWNVSVMITCRNPFERYPINVNTRLDVESYTISEEDSKQDIGLFLKHDSEKLRRLPLMQGEEPEDIALEIVNRSDGSFLWASIVFTKIQQVTSRGEIELVLKSIPPDMDALYSQILRDINNAQYGKGLAKDLLTWATYAFRPLKTAELQEPIEIGINDTIGDIDSAIKRCCGNMLHVNAQREIRFVHSTAREFLQQSELVEPDFYVHKANGHQKLALTCLRYLMDRGRVQHNMKSSRDSRTASMQAWGTTVPLARRRRTRNSIVTAGSEGSGSSASSPIFVAQYRTSPTTDVAGAFTDYASTFVFKHLELVHTNDDSIFTVLSTFLGQQSCLRWIEYVATTRNLHIIYEAGHIINSLLRRRGKHSPPLGLARGKSQEQVVMLEKWGDDLIHLVTKFSHWMETLPVSIHSLIPPFCPAKSAIRQQFTHPLRGMSVQGLSNEGWDDCLTTITYAADVKPSAVAAGQGFIAVGTTEVKVGRVVVYDDSIFQQVHTLQHGEPVLHVAFLETGQLLASAGATTVRIWSTADGEEKASFGIRSVCIALDFSEFEDEGCILRVATRRNELYEYFVGSCELNQQTWTSRPEAVQSLAPYIATFLPSESQLCMVYRGKNARIWNFEEDTIATYEKSRGCVELFGQSGIPEGSESIRAMCVGKDVNTNRLAIVYNDGDLVVFNLDDGRPANIIKGVNTMLVAASFDGRTLAAVDSSGNLSLFEFNTLRLLYRVQFDTRILPKGLTFTTDDRHFVEIRGNQCRVWGPTVLLRTDMPGEENSDTVSVSSGPQEYDYSPAAGENITALAVSRLFRTAFTATAGGSVYAYDTTDSSRTPVHLFTQAIGLAIDLLYVDEMPSVLSRATSLSLLIATGDLSGCVTVRHITRNNVARQRVWDVQEPIVVTRSPALGIVRQIVASANQQRLLVSTDQYDVLWPTPKQGEASWKAKIDGWARPHWVPHPQDPALLIRVPEVVASSIVLDSSFDLVRWDDLSTVRSVPVPVLTGFDRILSLQHSRFFVTVQKNSSPQHGKTPDASKNSTCIQIWDADMFSDETSSSVRQSVRKLQRGVKDGNSQERQSTSAEAIVGCVTDNRLIVSTSDHWIASIDLSQPDRIAHLASEIDELSVSSQPASISLQRHFFLPSDWVSVGPAFLMCVGPEDEFLFVKHTELAVVKRGLSHRTDAGFGSARLRQTSRPPFSQTSSTGPMGERRRG